MSLWRKAAAFSDVIPVYILVQLKAEFFLNIYYNNSKFTFCNKVVQSRNLNIKIRLQEPTYPYTKLERIQRSWEIKRIDGLQDTIIHQEGAQKKQKV